jgi:septal ring-binding cell division protein DamX
VAELPNALMTTGQAGALIAASTPTPLQQGIEPATVAAPMARGPAAPAAAVNAPEPAAQKMAPDASKSAATSVATEKLVPVAQNAALKPAPNQSMPAVVAAATGPDLSAGAKSGATNNNVSPTPPAGKLTRERFAATQEWLKSAPGNQYSIQLLTAGARDLRRVEELLGGVSARDLRLSDFYVYGVKISDQQHYRLAYGLYPTYGDANQGTQSLPAIYRQFAPFPRSVARMRSQNRQ